METGWIKHKFSVNPDFQNWVGSLPGWPLCEFTLWEGIMVVVIMINNLAADLVDLSHD